MLPEIDLGPIELKTFGLLFALGFLAAGLVLARRLVELGKPVDWAYEIVFSALVGGLVGSKLGFLAANPDEFSLSGLFGGSGLVWYGGALGGAIAVLTWAKVRGFFGVTLLDVCAAPLALGYAIGRVGCQVSGDGDYGVASDLPWAMAYPDGVVPTTEQVHPTPAYEAISVGLIALLLWHLRDRFAPGRLFALYLLLTGIERILVEFVRRNDAVLLGLTAAQLQALGIAVAGAIWLALTRDQPAPSSRAPASTTAA